MAIALLATLDTKGHELDFIRTILRTANLSTLVIDVGVQGEPAVSFDVSRDEVAELGGSPLSRLLTDGDRGAAIEVMARGAGRLAERLNAEQSLEGVIAIGGSAGTTIGTALMRALPFGVPKLMVSTMASGQTRPYVGGSDILMLHSVADIAGLNSLTRTVLRNAAAAMIGMVDLQSTLPDVASGSDRPVIAASMFGVTTPCVDRARRQLDALGYEVVVFHATGVGGRAMEGLIRDGRLAGVLDLTTTELADELVGGVLSAGPDRLQAAVNAGLPQVVSLGALDMVNFGPRETVPTRFEGRLFHVHNATVTLMRTTADECEALGRHIASTLAAARSPMAVLIPEGGVSALDAPGRPFHDPVADARLFESLEAGPAHSKWVRVERRPEHINDPAFADRAVALLHHLILDQARV